MKDQILIAAERSIRASGYADMSYRAIAAEVGLKSSTVHYHFPGKEVLGAAAMDRYSSKFFDALDAAAPTTARRGARLAAFVDAHADAFEASEQTCLCAVLSAEASALPQPVADSVRRHIQRCLEWLEDVAPGGGNRRGFAARAFSEIQGALVVATAMQSRGMLDELLAGVVARGRDQ